MALVHIPQKWHAGTPEDSSLEEAIALSMKRDSRLAESLNQDGDGPQNTEELEVALNLSMMSPIFWLKADEASNCMVQGS